MLRPFERLIYKLCGVNADKEMNWREYAYRHAGLFGRESGAHLRHRAPAGVLCPGIPQKLAAVGPDLAWNTAASFTTNTNWQSYTPETTMSYLTQMAGLATHNFWSAAVGIVVAVALIRGIKRTTSATIGNFWVDMTRTLLYILLPASFIYALLLVWQGVPQNLHAYITAHPLEQPSQVQTIAQGPVASQEAIKMLGTNGGGFFNANSAHPYENPTPFSNFLQILSIFIIPAGLTYTLGRMTGSPGHGWAVLAAMFILFAAGFTAVYWAESQPHPLIHGAEQARTATAPGGNMEGKEVRNGIAESSLFATITTDASCGAVNGVHDSFTPLGGMVVLTNIMLGELVFGGVGSGLYAIVIFVVLSVFIAGLMVGRTPEYLGKKIESYDVKMSMLYILIFPLIILSLTAVFVLLPNVGLSALTNRRSARPHRNPLRLHLRRGEQRLGLRGSQRQHLVVQRVAGLGHALRAHSDDDSSNRSGRQPGHEESMSPSPGTFPVNTSLFTVLLTGVILIVGALTFFPVLSLGPILEHLLLHSGQVF